MKITRKNLRLLLEQTLFSNTEHFVPKREWAFYKSKLKISHFYGDPKKRKDLREALQKKWPNIPEKQIPKLLCKTCHAFDTSKNAEAAGVNVKKGFGYCAPFKFACSENNSCSGWLPGKTNE